VVAVFGWRAVDLFHALGVVGAAVSEERFVALPVLVLLLLALAFALGVGAVDLALLLRAASAAED